MQRKFYISSLDEHLNAFAHVLTDALVLTSGSQYIANTTGNVWETLTTIIFNRTTLDKPVSFLLPQLNNNFYCQSLWEREVLIPD